MNKVSLFILSVSLVLPAAALAEDHHRSAKPVSHNTVGAVFQTEKNELTNGTQSIGTGAGLRMSNATISKNSTGIGKIDLGLSVVENNFEKNQQGYRLDFKAQGQQFLTTSVRDGDCGLYFSPASVKLRGDFSERQYPGSHTGIAGGVGLGAACRLADSMVFVGPLVQAQIGNDTFFGETLGANVGGQVLAVAPNMFVEMTGSRSVLGTKEDGGKKTSIGMSGGVKVFGFAYLGGEVNMAAISDRDTSKDPTGNVVGKDVHLIEAKGVVGLAW